jgi:hypothetical protein
MVRHYFKSRSKSLALTKRKVLQNLAKIASIFVSCVNDKGAIVSTLGTGTGTEDKSFSWSRSRNDTTSVVFLNVRSLTASYCSHSHLQQFQASKSERGKIAQL